jgi:phage terminase large subunit
MSGQKVVNAALPGKLRCLCKPARYKILYGGRGAGKSYGVALWLLAEAAARPQCILCCREFQTSIRDSVHKLLGDLIERLGLSGKFQVQQNSIRAVNGSEFIFEGLRHNISRICSLQRIDKVWVEEAQTASKASWEVLTPTVREEGSEIIVTFNPELESDETYQRFVVNRPPNAVVVQINYHDNPWFPSVLRAEMEHLKARDPDAYQHVWLGECRYVLDGVIYARELKDAQEEGRITSVPVDPTKPVSVYFDLGWADQTAVWFVQHIAGEVRLIDFLQNAQRPFSSYLQELQGRGYLYATMWLPHDAQAKSLGTGRSIEELARSSGGWRVKIVPKLSVADGINSVRTLFPTMWFDRDHCADGVQTLRHYRYDVDPDTGQFSRQPLHDHVSSASDALRYCAVAMQGSRRAGYKTPEPGPRPPYAHRSYGWMRD